MPEQDGCVAQACPGRKQAASAGCLADLLYQSPPSWLGANLLLQRDENGQWRGITRTAVQHHVLRLANWLAARGVKAGDRVGLLGHNGVDWFLADFAILRLGAVTVPAYFTDPPEAVAYIFRDAGCRLVLVEAGEQQAKLAGLDVAVVPFRGEGETLRRVITDARWDGELKVPTPKRDDLATIIYTSGTTGRPKGVMLTHGNILADVEACLGAAAVWPDDIFLSFLPVAHAFERTVGHFLPLACGSRIAYAEAVTTLMRDMAEVRPTLMISVPRLYEKIYAGVHEKLCQEPAFKRWLFALAQSLGGERFELRQQGRDLAGVKALAWRLLDRLVNVKLRARLGGRLRFFVSGGAALSPKIARFLLAADITVLPGYGLTESAPTLTVNRPERIKPETVGPPLPGVELKLDADGELLAKGPMVMQGYWHLPEATAAAIDKDGWLHTGDIAEIDDEGFVTIVDRKKEIMVLSNGENVSPAAIEQRLAHDPCIHQAMVVGEDKPFVAALVVADAEALAREWRRQKRQPLPEDWQHEARVYAWLLARMQAVCHDLPRYARVQAFCFVEEEWTQAGGMLTPTLKFKRRNILARHETEIRKMYAEQEADA